MKSQDQVFPSFDAVVADVFKDNQYHYFNSEIPCVDYVIDILSKISPIRAKKLVETVRGKPLLSEMGSKRIQNKNILFCYYIALNEMMSVKEPTSLDVVFFRQGKHIGHCGIFLDESIFYLHKLNLTPEKKSEFEQRDYIFMRLP